MNSPAPAGVEGEAGSQVTVVSLPGRRAAGAARRAGLEFVEKVLTKLTSTDTTERMLACFASRSAVSVPAVVASSPDPAQATRSRRE